MPAYLLTDELVFPPQELATEEGLLAIGGDASPQRLVLAYAQGIFPWPVEGLPLLWFCPDPRFVLDPRRPHFSRSLRKTIRRRRFRITADTAFDQVIRACARIPRRGQAGTWITDELLDGYAGLHERGYAHSVEAWIDDELVGGLYGVSLGNAFFGDSMFSNETDASKVAFATLLAQLVQWDFSFVDCQVYTDHLASFGARDITRAAFLSLLEEAVSEPTRKGRWILDVEPQTALELVD